MAWPRWSLSHNRRRPCSITCAGYSVPLAMKASTEVFPRKRRSGASSGFSEPTRRATTGRRRFRRSSSVLVARFLRRPLHNTRATALVYQIRSFGTCAMKHQRHFETGASREAAQTRTLIADLDRIVQILNSDIAAEEGRAGVSDCLQAEYPMHARGLAARRDNLKDTIAALEQRLTTIKEPQFEKVSG